MLKINKSATVILLSFNDDPIERIFIVEIE